LYFFLSRFSPFRKCAEIRATLELQSTKSTVTKYEYTDKAMELAVSCKTFAENTCQRWRDEVPGDEVPYGATGCEDLGEVREIYLTLQTLEVKAELLCQRVITLRRTWLQLGE